MAKRSFFLRRWSVWLKQRTGMRTAACVYSSCSMHQCLWDGSPGLGPDGCQDPGWAHYPDIIKGLKQEPFGDCTSWFFPPKYLAPNFLPVIWPLLATAAADLHAEHLLLVPLPPKKGRGGGVKVASRHGSAGRNQMEYQSFNFSRCWRKHVNSE